jgi:hypothetical protein
MAAGAAGKTWATTNVRKQEELHPLSCWRCHVQHLPLAGRQDLGSWPPGKHALLWHLPPMPCHQSSVVLQATQADRSSLHILGTAGEPIGAAAYDWYRQVGARSGLLGSSRWHAHARHLGLSAPGPPGAWMQHPSHSYVTQCNPAGGGWWALRGGGHVVADRDRERCADRVAHVLEPGGVLSEGNRGLSCVVHPLTGGLAFP